MASEKSQNPFENLDRSFDNVAGPSEPSSADVEPPPYTPAAIGSGPETTPRSPIPSQQDARNKPIAIPAIEPSFNSPFLRAYAPILRDYNLPRESFFTFLDQLNEVISTSAPLQVLDATGGILQSVPILFPLHWIGSTISGLANLGHQGVSKSRTDSYIKQANQDIFGPRGLKAEIVKHDALAYIANIPILDSKGKATRQMPESQRVLNEAAAGASYYPDSGVRYEHGSAVDLQEHRIQTLQPWIAELELDILPWTSKSRLTRFNAALKKRNEAEPVDTRRGRRRESRRESRKELCSNYDSSKDDEETKLRKGLWLLIRPIAE